MKKRILVVAAILIGSRLLAQQDSTTLDEVVITANKFPNKTSLTGKVVTVITRQQLERSGGRDLSQVLNEQAGMYINGANSNPGKDKSVYLRGARVDHTLFAIDGIPVYDASGIGGNFDIRNMPIDHIERIEVLKGSQSTLYGSDAIAGVINIITKKGRGGPLQATGMASYGSNGTLRTRAGVHGKKEKFDYNASLAFVDTKGINETVNSINLPVTDRDGYTQRSASVQAGFQPARQIRVQPFFRYSYMKGDIDQGGFTDELDYTFSQKSWQAGLRNEMVLGKSKLHLLYSYNHISREYVDDSVKSRNGFSTYSRGMYTGGEQLLDAYLHMPLGPSIKLTAGADYRASLSDQDYFYTSSWGAGSSTYANDSLRQQQLGLYAALHLATSTGFHLELGNRLNIHSEYGAHDVFNINPSWLLHRRVKLFANLSTAYRTPSLYQLFSEYGNRSLRPEAAITAEGGLQYFSRDQVLTGRIVVFSRKVKDVIFFYYNPSTFTSMYINQDRQNDHGLELEAGYTLAKSLVAKAFFTYTTGKISTRQNGKDSTYFNLLRRPKTVLGLNIGYQACKNLYLSSNLQVVGERKDAYFDPGSFSTVYTNLDGYLLWDFYAEYVLGKGKMTIFADLRNITDSRYTEVSGFATLGFNGAGGLRFKF